MTGLSAMAVYISSLKQQIAALTARAEAAEAEAKRLREALEKHAWVVMYTDPAGSEATKPPICKDAPAESPK